MSKFGTIKCEPVPQVPQEGEAQIHKLMVEYKPEAADAIIEARKAGVGWLTILTMLAQGLPTLIAFLQALFTPPPKPTPAPTPPVPPTPPSP